MYVLAALGGILYAFDNVSEWDIVDDVGLPGVLFLWILVGTISGFLGLLITPGVLRWTGSWFGGEASLRDIQHAYAWSYVILLPTFLGLLLLVAVFGGAMFSSADLPADGPVIGAVLLLVYIAVAVVLVIWALVTFFRALSEVQRFSVWKAVGSAAIPFLALVALGVGAALVLR